MHVNLTHGEVNQVRTETILMHQQRTYLDLPRFTGKCVNCFRLLELVFLFFFVKLKLNGFFLLFYFNIFSMFLKLVFVFFL